MEEMLQDLMHRTMITLSPTELSSIMEHLKDKLDIVSSEQTDKVDHKDKLSHVVIKKK